MSPLIMLSFWSTILTVIICYGWWSRFRVWVLRQDLFAIRDKAWDTMLAKGALDDPAHRQFREAANAMIRFAPDLTLFTVWRIVVGNLERPTEPFAAVPPEIQVFHDEVCVRLARYLLFESIAGWALVSLAIIFRMFALTRDWLTRKVASIFDSPDLRVFGKPGPERMAPGF